MPVQSAPPEARSGIGARALAYGVGTKDDGDIPDPREVNSPEQLEPVPVVDNSWSDDAAAAIIEASSRAARIGEIRLANLWRRNLGRPRSTYSDVPALQRMLARMEHSHAAKRRALPPVHPARLYTSIAELALAGTRYPVHLLPPAIATAVLAAINGRLIRIAAAGFADASAVHAGNAPADIVQLKAAISSTTGATVRVLNQIGHLLNASRLGQTSHHPMTIGRRRGLLASALDQLADDTGAGPWTPEQLRLMTDSVRQAWRTAERRRPTPSRTFRDLFAWADRDHPDPRMLDLPDLELRIQHHPDLVYVERLRQERLARTATPPRTL